MVALLINFFNERKVLLDSKEWEQLSLGDVKQAAEILWPLNSSDVHIVSPGVSGIYPDHLRPLSSPSLLSSHSLLELNVTCRCLGGKGGFGSMLRAMGGKMSSKKSTNVDSCRDQQGRRIRTVNQAKRLAEHILAEKDQEEEKKKRLQQKITQGLLPQERKKARFEDPAFFDETLHFVENTRQLVKEVLQLVPQPLPNTTETAAVKRFQVPVKKLIWDEDTASMSSGSSQDDSTASPAQTEKVSASPRKANPRKSKAKKKESQNIQDMGPQETKTRNEKDLLLTGNTSSSKLQKDLEKVPIPEEQPSPSPSTPKQKQKPKPKPKRKLRARKSSQAEISINEADVASTDTMSSLNTGRTLRRKRQASSTTPAVEPPKTKPLPTSSQLRSIENEIPKASKTKLRRRAK